MSSVILADEEQLEPPQDLLAKLEEMQESRGEHWNFQEGRRLADELLERYRHPAHQARICVTFLMTHGFSGIPQPNVAIEYARRAESLPMAPLDESALYSFWADAAHWKNRGKTGQLLAAARRDTLADAMPKLSALRSGVKRRLTSSRFVPACVTRCPQTALKKHREMAKNRVASAHLRDATSPVDRTA